MVEYVNIPINVMGLDEKADPRQLEPGRLTIADNVEMRESGKLSRRRGYLRLPTAYAMDGNSLSDHGLFHRLATWRQQLVVLAHDRLLAVADRASATTVSAGVNSGLVNKGPVPRCSMASHIVATGGIYDVPAGG